MSTKKSEKTIVFDLDATWANYGGWSVHGEFPGEPREDVTSAARRLKEAGYTIGILTTRNTEVAKKWVEHHGLGDLIDFVNDSPHQPPGCSHKPIAFCYIDDRGVRYNGTNMEEICEQILSGKLEPWYKNLVPKDYYRYHHPDCGTSYRGCHPSKCPKNQYETTGVWKLNWD